MEIATGASVSARGMEGKPTERRLIWPLGQEAVERLCRGSDSRRRHNRDLWHDDGLCSIRSEIYWPRRRALSHISHSLIPVISHDRAGFGGGLCSIGCLLLFMARCAPLTRSFVEVVAVMGIAGFGGAIGVHFAVGYLDFLHLLPAFLGLLLFLLANGLLWAGWRGRRAAETK
jgi:hypothetical protein